MTAIFTESEIYLVITILVCFIMLDDYIIFTMLCYDVIKYEYCNWFLYIKYGTATGIIYGQICDLI